MYNKLNLLIIYDYWLWYGEQQKYKQTIHQNTNCNLFAAALTVNKNVKTDVIIKNSYATLKIQFLNI